MKKLRMTILFMALVITPTVLAQFNLTGTWNLQTTVQLPDEPAPCLFEGLSQITHTGSTITGTSDLTLVSGPPACPAEMLAALNGTVTNATTLMVAGTLTGQLGQATFTGTLTPNPGGGGRFDTTQGPFMGQAGTWTARQILGGAIPFLTPIGLTLLVLSILATGAWLLRTQPLA